MSEEIVKSEFVHPGELTEFPANSNTHSPQNIDELAAGRRKFTQYKNIVIWQPAEEMTVTLKNGKEATLKPGIKYVIAGNGLHQASIKRRDDNIEIKDFSHLSYGEAVLLAEYDNASPLSSKIDPEQMKANLDHARSLYVDNEQMAQTMERARKLAGVVEGSGEDGKDVGQGIDKAEELQKIWQVEAGQLWQIGDHKLLCGDCRNPGDLARLTGGEKVNLVVTDPPYGVGYANKNKYLNTISPGNRIQTEIKGDHETKEETQALWKAAFREMSKVMLPGAVVYCFMPQGGDQMMMMMMMMRGAGIEPRHEIIWLKNNHVLGRVDYAYKHEPILYAWKDGGHKFYGGFQTSILEFDKPLRNDLHPTQKPVELIRKLVRNSSKAGENVYDPFAGSGTTGIAAQNEGRRSLLMELLPKYCSVILQRFQDTFNIKPKLIT